jgi:hypothetical protein
MANFPVDPRPHLPTGFTLCDVPREELLLRHRAFLGLSAERASEHAAIAIFFSRVAKEDFKQLARALRLHLLTDYNVSTLEIQPCPFGDAYRFLNGPPLSFDGYSIRFVKHDEGDNAREFDMDREVWLMLLGYPLDARSTSAIAKVVSGFAMLRHVHESHVMSRIVIKVSMNSENQVPPLVVLGVGDEMRISVWTVSVFFMSATSKSALSDEDALPSRGPLHPLPDGWALLMICHSLVTLRLGVTEPLRRSLCLKSSQQLMLLKPRRVSIMSIQRKSPQMPHPYPQLLRTLLLQGVSHLRLSDQSGHRPSECGTPCSPKR